MQEVSGCIIELNVLNTGGPRYSLFAICGFDYLQKTGEYRKQLGKNKVLA